jgi:hypothetical protein
MKIKNVTVEQAELSDKEIEILSKIKSYCNNQLECSSCIFNKDEYACHMNKIWAQLKNLT